MRKLCYPFCILRYSWGAEKIVVRFDDNLTILDLGKNIDASIGVRLQFHAWCLLCSLLYASLTLNPRPLVAQKVTRTDELKFLVQKSRPLGFVLCKYWSTSTGVSLSRYIDWKNPERCKMKREFSIAQSKWFILKSGHDAVSGQQCSMKIDSVSP